MAETPSTSTIYESLRCAICLEPATEAVETVCCHHIGCLKCLEPLGKCPTCQKEGNIETQSSIAIRRMIDNLPVECSNECGVKTTRGELAAHLNICQSKPTACPVAECDFAHKDVDELVSHMIQQHPETIATILKTHLNATLFNAPTVEKCLFPNCEVEVESDPFWKHAKDAHKNELEMFKNVDSLCIVSKNEPLKLKNGADAYVKMGENGKFYCSRENRIYSGYNYESGTFGMNQRTACRVLNNCVDCMKLDLIFRDLAPPQLVNSDGRVCTPSNNSRMLYGGFYNTELRTTATAYFRMCGSPKYYCGCNSRLSSNYNYKPSKDADEYCGPNSKQCTECGKISGLMARRMYNSVWD